MGKGEASSQMTQMATQASVSGGQGKGGGGSGGEKKSSRFRTLFRNLKWKRKKGTKDKDKDKADSEGHNRGPRAAKGERTVASSAASEEAEEEEELRYDWLPRRVQKAPYFHGMIHKDELTCLLKEPGDFLLRLGRSAQSANCVILSVLWQGSPRHFLIRRGDGGVWIDEGVKYKDEVALVEAALKNNIGLGFNNIRIKKGISKAAWELDKADIELKKEIGKGEYGRVHVGLLKMKQNGKTVKVDVAVKTCDLTSGDLEAQNVFMKEAEIGRRYSHPNVIKVYGIQCKEPPLMIVMEYAPDGSLLTFLRSRADSLSQTTLLRFARDGCNAMEFLARVKVLHRDVAARNFLVAAGRSVKIADFGLARPDCLNIRSGSARLKFSLKWLPPEVLTLGNFSAASEVWMFGVTLWEIMTLGKEPFPDMSKEQYKIRMRTKPFHLDPDPGWPAPVRDALAAAFVFDPAQRAPITTIGRFIDAALGNPTTAVIATAPRTTRSNYENASEAGAASSNN